MKNLQQLTRKLLIQLYVSSLILCSFFPLFSQDGQKKMTDEMSEVVSKMEEKGEDLDSDNLKRKIFPCTFETDLTLMLLYPWGFILEVGETMDIALLRFANSLTHNNSLKFRGGIKLTPITLEADFKATNYLNVVVATQLFTQKNYEKSADTFYERNRIKTDGPSHYVVFSRLAISCVFTFKH